MATPRFAFSPRVPLRPRRAMTIEVALRGVTPVIHHSTNQWGLRGDEPPRDWQNTYTIITLGDSTTICHYLDDQNTWPAQLEQSLQALGHRVWVGNAALDGQSTRSHLKMMEDIVAHLRPNVVVILAGLSDLGFSLSETRRQLGNPYERVGWFTRLHGTNRLVQQFQWWGVRLQRPRVMRRAEHVTLDPIPLAQEDEPIHVPADVTSLLPALPEYRQNLQQLVRLARAHNLRVVFLTQPLLFDDTQRWQAVEGVRCRVNGVKRPLSAANYWRLLDRHNQTLLEVCANEGAETFDLASHIPHEERYFYDMFHFTEAGAALVGRCVGEYIQRHLWQQHVVPMSEAAS